MLHSYLHLHYLLTLLFLILAPLCLTQCPANCHTCSTSTTCLICQPTHYLSPPSPPPLPACIANPPGCLAHTTSSCSICDPGYRMDNSSCYCLNGRGYDTNTRRCRFCQGVNCQQCRLDYMRCTKCVQGYGIDAGAGAGTCRVCVSNCLQCGQDYQVCTACAQGYGLTPTNTCLACQVTHCKHCPHDPSTCTQCLPPYGTLTPLVSSQCIPCVANCLQCPRSSLHCKTCSPNYGPVMTGPSKHSCLPCSDPNCLTCSHSHLLCLTCKPGHTLLNNRYCKPNSCTVSNCVTCGGLGCSYCIDGRGWGILSGACISCTDGDCMRCSNWAVACTYCRNGRSNTGNGCSDSCQDSSCRDCSANDQVCIACSDGQGVTADHQCSPCIDTNCAVCGYDQHVCLSCKSGYGLTSWGQSISCEGMGCVGCDGMDYRHCTACQLGYGVVGDGTCAVCVQQQCYQCYASPLQCTKCVDGYIATISNTCQPCISHCYRCPTTTTCSICNPGYALSAFSTCLPCTDPHTQLCSQNDPSSSTFCRPGYILNINTNSCQLCSIPFCILCLNTSSICSTCLPGYGINPINNTCSTCIDSNCLSCPTSIATCIQCQHPYALDTDACVECNPVCRECQAQDKDQCISCYNGSMVVNGTCLECVQGCASCSIITACDVCIEAGWHRNSSTSLCQQCPQYCTMCTQITAMNLVQCSACADGYQLQSNLAHGYLHCVEICGDLIAMGYDCDQAIGIQYDGCTDQCQVEEGFQCVIGQGNVSVCSYERSLLIEVREVRRAQAGENQFVMVVAVWPRLDVFKYIDSEGYAGVFVVQGAQYCQLLSIKYNIDSSEFTIIASFTPQFASLDSLHLLFVPTTTLNPHFFATQPTTLTQPLPFNKQLQFCYYSSFARALAYNLQTVCRVSVGLGWLGVAVGLWAGRLAGLEGMVVLQLGYVGVLWVEGGWYWGIGGVTGLGYAVGWGYRGVMQEEGQGGEGEEGAPYTGVFGLSREYFVNNFNLMLGPQVALFVAYLVLTIIARIYIHIHKLKQPKLKRYMDTADNSISQQNLPKQLQKYQQLFLRLLMYCTVVNLLNFISCLSIYLQKSTHLFTQSLDIIAIGLYLCIFIFVVGQFFFNPDPFNQFRYSFRKHDNERYLQLTFNQFLINLCMYLVCTCLMVWLPGYLYSPLIVLGVVGVYVAVLRPYDGLYENIRFIFGLLVMASVIGLRMYLGLNAGNICNSTLTDVLILGVFCVLIPLCLVLGLISIIYHVLFMNWARKKLSQNQLMDRQLLYRKTKKQILFMLPKVNPKNTAKMQQKQERQFDNSFSQNQNFNIFKQLAYPKQSLQDYSNQLYHSTIQLQKQVLKNIQTQRPLKFYNSFSEDPASPTQLLRPNQPKLTDNQIKSTEINKQLLKSINSMDQIKQQQIPTQIQTPQQMEPIAKQILIEENKQVNLKSTAIQIRSQMARDRVQGGQKYQFLQFYANIEYNKEIS